MSDEFEYGDEYGNDEGPKALRELVKKLQGQVKGLESKLGDAHGQIAERDLASVLSGQQFKNPARVKSAILADGIDTSSKEAVEKWLNDNGDEFAKAAPSGEAAQEQQAAPSVSAETQQQYQSLNIQGQSAPNLSDYATRLEAAKAKITPDMDGKAVAALYAEHGI